VISLMPTTLYGLGDNYPPENSHVLPALFRRFYKAKQRDDTIVTCWVTGKPLRKFLRINDLGKACAHALEVYNPNPGEPIQHLNVGFGIDLPIRDHANHIAMGVDFNRDIYWKTTKPDGTPKKQLDMSRLEAMGWKAEITLEQGHTEVYSDHLKGEVRR
jgi:GDP-L-fucose synthase